MTDELDRLLTLWAARQRLTASEVHQVRGRVLATTNGDTTLDSDWLWARLRPMTDLLEHMGGSRALRYLSADDGDASLSTPYLRLA